MPKKLKIMSGQAGQRLDILLTDMLDRSRSRSRWQKLINSEDIKVNGKSVKPSYQVETGDVVEITDQPADENQAIEPPKLKTVYEDEFVLVVNKPAGLLVHAVPGRPSEPTLAGFAKTKSTDEDPDRPGIVHRLDRDTSGLMIIAKDAETKKYLQDQFRKHQVKKTYTLLVWGHLKETEALIDLPIGRQTDSALRTVAPTGKPSQTVYKVTREYPTHSLIEASPMTGRTHQLRVHFAHLGHPIVGDRLYGNPAQSQPGRLFLHASKLEFSNPKGAPISLTQPLPQELRQFLKTLDKPV